MNRFIALFLLSVGLSVAATVLAMWATPRLAAMRADKPADVAGDPPGTL